MGVVPRSRGVGVVSYSRVSSAKKNKSCVHWNSYVDNTKAGGVTLLLFGHDALSLYIMNEKNRILAFKMFFT